MAQGQGLRDFRTDRSWRQNRIGRHSGRMLRTLVAVMAVAGCCSPALAETLNSFRHAHGLPALQRSGSLQAMAIRRTIDHSGFYSGAAKPVRARKMWLADAPAKAAPLLYGRDRPATAKTCCGRRTQIWIGIVWALLVPGSRPIAQIDSNSFASDAQKPHRGQIL